jgi:hypothetical protein
MAQNFLENIEPFPTTMRFEMQMRRPAPSSGPVTSQIRSAYYSSAIGIEQEPAAA